MQFFILVLIFCLVLFLFRLYHLGNDDFILLKKNVSLEDVFNSVIFCSLISLFIARFFYVFFHPNQIFLNPLGFILFPYFPGLSITGGIIGGCISFILLAKIKKFPTARILDFFAVSLVFVIPVGFLGYFLLSRDITNGGVTKFIIFLIISVFANLYLYPKARALEIKDGTLATLFLIFYSLISMLGLSIDNPGIKNFISHKENLILVGILVISLTVLLKNEVLGRIFIKSGK